MGTSTPSGNGHSGESDAARRRDAEQTLADTDQTSADSDQTAADLDQASSDGDLRGSLDDQAGSNADQRASDRDQKAADREEDSLPAPEQSRSFLARETARSERARTSLERALTTAGRTKTAVQRLEIAEQRDVAARSRDLAATGRDLAADARDKISSARSPRNAGLARERAADDRQRAAGDRLKAARDRAETREDRDVIRQALNDAQLDDLTGTYRRAMGTLALQGEVDRAQRTHGRLVLAFVDVDDLKAHNSAGGHAAGDALLRGVVTNIRANLRSYDPVVRFGGDEFVCALCDADTADARNRFHDIQVNLSDAIPGGTFSVGFAELTADDRLDDLITRGDLALTDAKNRRAAG